MTNITLLELAGATRLVFLEVRIARFHEAFDDSGNGGVMEIKPTLMR